MARAVARSSSSSTMSSRTAAGGYRDPPKSSASTDGERRCNTPPKVRVVATVPGAGPPGTDHPIEDLSCRSSSTSCGWSRSIADLCVRASFREWFEVGRLLHGIEVPPFAPAAVELVLIDLLHPGHDPPRVCREGRERDQRGRPRLDAKENRGVRPMGPGIERVAYSAHVGGFITGLVLVRLFSLPDRVRRMRDRLEPSVSG